MTRQLRAAKQPKNGLILANGGVLSYQHVIILSSYPRTTTYPTQNPLPNAITDIPVPEIEGKPLGEAVIEVRTPRAFSSRVKR
jgi:hypothetical protein